MVTVCMIYALLQLAFILSAGLVNTDTGHSFGDGNYTYFENVEIRLLGGGNWTYFYVCAVIIGFIANMYVFTVALFWLTVILVISLVIAIFITFIFFVILIGGGRSRCWEKQKQMILSVTL